MDAPEETDPHRKTPGTDKNEDACLINGSCTYNKANDEAPQPKRMKLISSCNTQRIDLTFNGAYATNQFMQSLSAQWSACAHEVFTDPTTNAKVYTEPYQICLLPALLQSKDSCKQLVDEMVEKVKWSRKQMDLYEFYQSTDLSNMSECKLLTGFLQMLRRHVRPWLEKMTNLKLDYVSASCSMYTCGDYLLVHDDLLKDRQVAFVYYLSPWDGVETWDEKKGGCLEIFDTDENCLPQFPPKYKISPKNNQFAFFKVCARSFHQVGEVTNFDYPRLTINGWFHGASNEDLQAHALKPFDGLKFLPPQEIQTDLLELVNHVYLKTNTRKHIQKRIEDNSAICLYDFFKHEVFMKALTQLRSDETLSWKRQGPANVHNYEVLESSTATETVAQLLTLLGSKEMFALLRDYTDLDLAGENATSPSYCVELQRWSHGNYTVLGDGALCDENTLDLIYYVNAAEGAGVMTYLSSEDEHAGHISPQDSDDEDDSALLTITPVDNALNIVYRCEGTTKFTKYVSCNTPMENGPVFVISCSYKE